MMDRRQLILGAIFSLAPWSQARTQGAWGRPWTKVPSVTALYQGKDERVQLVHDAVDYWNRTFAEIGSKFRLGAVTETAGAIPVGDLAMLSEAALNGRGSQDLPQSVRRIAGDIVVALSDGDFISFSFRSLALQKAVAAIRSAHLLPLTLPNVARNVITHELGHAIGLGHNADPTKLMCGRPAPCRPAAFASPTARFFPLTGDEKASLLAMYQANWVGR